MPLLSQRSVGAGSLVHTEDDATLPVILEFSSPSAAIIARKVPLLARGTVWAIGGLFAACLLAMWLIPVDRVVTAPGKIASRVPTIIVQPLETSIVRAIDVTEGESVHAGDLLARLDPTFTAADVGASESQVSALAAEVSRLEAEAAGRPFVYAGADPNLSLQAAIYAQRQSERKLKRETYQQRIGGLQAAIERSPTDRTHRRGGRRRPVLSMRAKTTSLFDRDQTRAWRERGAWRSSADVVRTALVCPDARSEVKLSGAARQGGRRSRS